ncbi:MAG TPA: glycosyltransferase [Candidatus Acidoferrales bacterium]
MLISVIIPAFNEESYLPQTLARLQDTISACARSVEVLLVDNESTDRTAEIARSFGATVVLERVHNIGRVRNTGAKVSRGDVLVFIDADTVVPPHFLSRVADTMARSACLGGSAGLVHRPASKLLRAYLEVWRCLGTTLGMAQGAAQFCQRSAFSALNGYDESQFMGEDVDFYWRLKKFSKKMGGYLVFLKDVKVVPSPRRFDNSPIWRTLVWTNPLFVAFFRKTRSAWGDWYVRTPR